MPVDACHMYDGFISLIRNGIKNPVGCSEKISFFEEGAMSLTRGQIKKDNDKCEEHTQLGLNGTKK